jgi:hypothetical protein
MQYVHGKVIALAATAAALAASAPASSATVAFTGTRANVNTINPPGTGRCAPLNTVNIAPGALSSTGSSNFGAFASTQSHCIAGPPNPMNPVRQITDGEFTYAFATGDSLFGTYTGTATFANGVVTGVENLIVTGGTGKFLNATGTILATGTLRFGMVNGATVGIFDGTVNGMLNAPGVPEPASWAMMIAGFAAIGLSSRRRVRAAYA